MAVEDPSAGGADPGAGGDPEPKKESVSYETHARLLAQRKKDQDARKTLEDKVTAFEKSAKEAEDAKLSEQGEFKKMVVQRDEELAEKAQELAQSKADLDQANKNLTNGVKLQAFVDKLPGRIKNHEYLSFADTDAIAIDPETGRVDEGSLNKVVNGFVEKHASLLETKGIKLPGDGAAGGGAALTHEEWLKLPLKEKKERMAEVMNN